MIVIHFSDLIAVGIYKPSVEIVVVTVDYWGRTRLGLNVSAVFMDIDPSVGQTGD